MMDLMIKRFPAQLKDALEIAETSTIRSHQSIINKVVMAGMGGSGMGGNIVADLIKEECPCPFISLNSYQLPAYVDKNTLVIISSYSGNTEETIAILHQAIETPAKVVCISSGGEILRIAEDEGLDYITLPSGWPSPRACVGYSVVQQLSILYKLRLTSRANLDQIRSAIELLSFEQDDIMMKAEKIAGLLFDKTPILYSTDRIESIAIRWRQQINENAKTLCWHHVLPEMNHNELVGWHKKDEALAVIFLRNKDDFKKNQMRFEITKKLVGQYAGTVIEIYAKGQTLSEKMMYFLHLGDWVSWYLAKLNNVDASEIKAIDYLKSELNRLD
jgi:glucose/mannose-6-phosphate isomerase